MAPIEFQKNQSIEDITLKLNQVLEKMILKTLTNGYGLTTDGNNLRFSLFIAASL